MLYTPTLKQLIKYKLVKSLNMYNLMPTNKNYCMKKKYATIRILSWIFLILMLFNGESWGQTYYDMSSGDYSQNFNSITALPINFSNVGVISSGTIPVATKTTIASSSSLSM